MTEVLEEMDAEDLRDLETAKQQTQRWRVQLGDKELGEDVERIYQEGVAAGIYIGREENIQEVIQIAGVQGYDLGYADARSGKPHAHGGESVSEAMPDATPIAIEDLIYVQRDRPGVTPKIAQPGEQEETKLKGVVTEKQVAPFMEHLDYMLSQDLFFLQGGGGWTALTLWNPHEVLEEGFKHINVRHPSLTLVDKNLDQVVETVILRDLHQYRMERRARFFNVNDPPEGLKKIFSSETIHQRYQKAVEDKLTEFAELIFNECKRTRKEPYQNVRQYLHRKDPKISGQVGKVKFTVAFKDGRVSRLVISKEHRYKTPTNGELQGPILTAVRETKNLSIADLSELTKLPQSVLRSYEIGNQPPHNHHALIHESLNQSGHVTNRSFYDGIRVLADIRLDIYPAKSLPKAIQTLYKRLVAL